MVNDKNNVFRFRKFGKEFGGTEIMAQGLLDNVNNDLLKTVDIFVQQIPSNFRDIKKEKPFIFWVHDLPIDTPYLNEKEIETKIDNYIFVSHWQKEQFKEKYNLDDKKCSVIKNCIEPIQVDLNKKFHDKLDKIKICYTSTPQRGLNILYYVFKEIYKEFGDSIELNVYSSFNIYNQPQRNKPFKQLFNDLQKTDGIKYHGSVDHDNLIKNLKENHIWVLPSIHPETYCIALTEAISAGCVAIHSSLASLPESSKNCTIMYEYLEDINNHAELFESNLKSVIITSLNESLKTKQFVGFNKAIFDTIESWQRRKGEWEHFLKNLQVK